MPSFPIRTLSLVAAVAAIASCDAPPPASLPSNPATETYANVLNVDISKMTRIEGMPVYIRDSIVGSGAALDSSKTFTANYKGWLINGANFQNGALTPAGPVTGVVPGLGVGLLGMKVGGWRKVVIGSAAGYGSTGSGLIPPNATIIFNIQLTSVQ